MKENKKIEVFVSLFISVVLLIIPQYTAYASAKWNPGHYVMVNQGNEMNEFNVTFNTCLQGAKCMITWKDLEPSEGVYDFSSIDKNLEYLKVHDKRLIIGLAYASVSGKLAWPEYLMTDPKYRGGYEPFPGKSVQGIARIWDPIVNERFQALLVELGKKYDSDPYFEGICFDESAISVDKKTALEFTYQKWHDVLKENISFAKSVFPNTNVWQHINWLSTDMSDLVNHCYISGAGMGGPDVIPLSGKRTHIPAYSFYPQYAGKISLCTDVQYPEFGGKEGTFTVQELFEMGVDVLKLDHMVWQKADSGTYTPKFTTEILPYIIKQNGRINTTLPENLRDDFIKTSVAVSNEIKVLINGSSLKLDVPPTIVNDRIMLPVRAIFEALEAEVVWDEKTNSVYSKKGDTKITLQIDNKNAKVNDTDKILDIPPVIVDGRILVPARFVAESLGCTVDWEETANKIVIKSVAIPVPTAAPTQSTLITDLVVNDNLNANSWSIKTNLQAGDLRYGDRIYKFTSIPASIVGCDWIRTAGDSKRFSGNKLVSFKVTRNADVYIIAGNTPISWMTGWKETGESLDENTKLFKKSFDAGAIIDMGNNGDAKATTYTIVVKPQ